MKKRVIGVLIALVMYIGVGLKVSSSGDIILSSRYQGINFDTMNLLEYASFFVGDPNLHYNQSNGYSESRLEVRGSINDQKHRKADGSLDYNLVACSEHTNCMKLDSTSCIRVDCSLFVQCVMAHCGISVPGTTQGYYNQLFGSGTSYPNLRVVPDEEAIAGDVVFWYDAEGGIGHHVALYIGNNEIIHTNTSHNKGSTPQDDTLINRRDLYKADGLERVIVRVVDDSEIFNPDGSFNPNGAFGDIDSTSTYYTVIGLPKMTGSLVMEGDLVGVEPVWSAGEQDMITLLSRDSLGIADRVSLTTIGNNMKTREITLPGAVGIISQGLGMVLMVYGFLLIIAGVFDTVNQFIDISLVKLFSFGKWYIVDDEDIEGRRRGKHFISVAGFAVRVVVVTGIGVFLVSGSFARLIVWLFSRLIT